FPTDLLLNEKSFNLTTIAFADRMCIILVNLPTQLPFSFFFSNPRVLIPPTKFFEKLYNITKKALILRLKLLRKGRDSNPRYSHPVYRLSRSAHSTTLTPFQRRSKYTIFIM